MVDGDGNGRYGDGERNPLKIVFSQCCRGQMSYFHISVPRGSMIAVQWSIFYLIAKNGTLKRLINVPY